MKYWWAILGGSALAYVLTRSSSRRRRLESTSDQEWLARVVIMEHGSAGAGDEWTAIMQVVVNRTAHQSFPATIREVVTTRSWPGGGDRGAAYLEAIQADGGVGYESATGRYAPPDSRAWSYALEHAGRFLSGEFRNRIGTRVHQCHPGSSCGYQDSSFPEIKEHQLNGNGRMKCISGRLIPLWALPLDDPDSRSDQEPVVVGTGIFS